MLEVILKRVKLEDIFFVVTVFCAFENSQNQNKQHNMKHCLYIHTIVYIDYESIELHAV